MKTTVAVLNKHGENVVPQVLGSLDALRPTYKPMHYGLITPKKVTLDKNPDLIGKQTPPSNTAVATLSSKPGNASGYSILQLDDSALLFEGRAFSPMSQDALNEQLSKESQHCEAALQTLIQQTDGDYMFLMLKYGWIAAGRDPIGVQPLYFGETSQIAAYATNKKALWQLGIQDPKSFPPGNLGFTDHSGFKFEPIKVLPFIKPTSINLEAAAKKLLELLYISIQRRVHGLKKAAVAFSGGLDSSIVAFLTKRQDVKVELVHVSMENEAETQEAMAVAEALDLPIQIHLFKDSDVEKTLPLVVELIEEPDPIKASIGLPFYWVAQKAAEAGYKAVLAGQGADELFGGYQRYVTEYCKDGAEAVLRTMFGDVVNIYASNLERDLKITRFLDVELRLPFAAFEVAEFALSLPVECKIEQKPDTLRKLVLRKASLDAGMPRRAADKPKKAVQYSTGINDAVKRTAKKHHKTVNQYVADLFLENKTKT